MPNLDPTPISEPVILRAGPAGQAPALDSLAPGDRAVLDFDVAFRPTADWRSSSGSLFEAAPEALKLMLAALAMQGGAVEDLAPCPEGGTGLRLHLLRRDDAWSGSALPAGVERLALESLRECGDWRAVLAFARARRAAGSYRFAVIAAETKALRVMGDWQSLADVLPKLFAHTPQPWLLALLAEASLRLGRNAETVFAAMEFARRAPQRQAEAQTLVLRALLAEGVTWPQDLLPEARLHVDDFSPAVVAEMCAAPEPGRRIRGLDLDARPAEALSLLRADPGADPLQRANAEVWARYADSRAALDEATLNLLATAPQSSRAAGLLTYATTNIGDDIQSLAASQYLDAALPLDLLDRDALAGLSRSAPRRVLMNGWYAHRGAEGETWPPSTAIVPTLVSVHVTAAAARNLLSPAGQDWFRHHGPVGCRDDATARLMQRHGIDAQVTGCLTLTLKSPANADAPRHAVWAVDLDVVSAEVLTASCARLALEVPRPRTHEFAIGRRDGLFRLLLAARLLHDYARARLVVTSRLHCALPCIAMGTPVVMVVPDPQDPRFPGLVPPQILLSAQEFATDPDAAIRTALEQPCPVPPRAQELRSCLRDEAALPGDSWYTRLMRLSRAIPS